MGDSHFTNNENNVDFLCNHFGNNFGDKYDGEEQENFFRLLFPFYTHRAVCITVYAELTLLYVLGRFNKLNLMSTVVEGREFVLLAEVSDEGFVNLLTGAHLFHVWSWKLKSLPHAFTCRPVLSCDAVVIVKEAKEEVR